MTTTTELSDPVEIAAAVLADRPAELVAIVMSLLSKVTVGDEARHRDWEAHQLIAFVWQISKQADDYDWGAFRHSLLCTCEGFKRTISETTGWDDRR